MTSPPITVRTMTRAELDIAVQWAADEGWNPGLHDADCFYAQDPEGFFIALADDEPVGTVSAVKYGDAYGFLGFYIVKPEYRHGRAGALLALKALESLGGRIMGLDGVVEQQANYKKIGFELIHRGIRYAGRGAGEAQTPEGIVALGDLPFEDVAAYDDATFGYPRREFLRLWISRPRTTALGLSRGGRLAGYGVLRKCRVGYKIGPLFAADAGAAETLFIALTGRAPENSPVFFDTPEANPPAVEMAERHRMAKVFETARMYRNGRPAFPMEKWFGVTSFELG